MPPLEQLACPVCKGELTVAPAAVDCSRCGRAWPRRGEVVDFVAEPSSERDGWSERQREMVEWYDDLVADRDQAIHCLRTDYGAIAPRLRALSGRVLDLGGGAGITRHYLDPSVEYVNLDPSLEWLDPRWADVASSFPPAAEPMRFVRGVGEHLPFRSGTFDAVLSLWSLNHASSTGLVLAESGRVLRRGGLLFLVLEDMEPRWHDLIQRPLRRQRRMVAWKAAVAAGARSWPVQPDHTKVEESELLRLQSGQFAVERREWVGAGPPSYLTFALRRR